MCTGTPQMQPEHANLYQSTPSFFLHIHAHVSQSMARAFHERAELGPSLGRARALRMRHVRETRGVWSVYQQA